MRAVALILAVSADLSYEPSPSPPGPPGPVGVTLSSANPVLVEADPNEDNVQQPTETTEEWEAAPGGAFNLDCAMFESENPDVSMVIAGCTMTCGPEISSYDTDPEKRCQVLTKAAECIRESAKSAFFGIKIPAGAEGQDLCPAFKSCFVKQACPEQGAPDSPRPGPVLVEVDPNDDNVQQPTKTTDEWEAAHGGAFAPGSSNAGAGGKLQKAKSGTGPFVGDVERGATFPHSQTLKYAHTYWNEERHIPAAAKYGDTCPYGDDSSMKCHLTAAGAGNKCPVLQQRRMMMSHNAILNSIPDFIERAQDFKLRPGFDKTDILRGDETYEEMIRLHIEQLKTNDDVRARVIDRINLEETAKDLGISTVKQYYTVHKSGYAKGKFVAALTGLCVNGGNSIHGLVLRASHLATVEGSIKFINDWKFICESQARLDEEIEKLVQWVDTFVFNPTEREKDDADTNPWSTLLEPGLIVEEMIHTGGKSTTALQVKMQVVWGKVHNMWFVGEDPRGCHFSPGSWQYFVFDQGTYPPADPVAGQDWAGWDGSDVYEHATMTTDAVAADILTTQAFLEMQTHAQDVAKKIGADYLRVDFMLVFSETDALKPTPVGLLPAAGFVYKLANIKPASEMWYERDRSLLEIPWREGYVMNNRFKMTEEKYNRIVGDTKASRDLNIFNAKDEFEDGRNWGIACAFLGILSFAELIVIISLVNVLQHSKAAPANAHHLGLADPLHRPVTQDVEMSGRLSFTGPASARRAEMLSPGKNEPYASPPATMSH